MLEKENFEDVKIGDLIKYSAGHWHSTETICKVTAVTPTQFSVGNRRFRKTDGRMVGERYTYCHHATQEDIDRINAERHERTLRNGLYQFFQRSSNLDKLSVSDMEAITIIISQHQ